MAQPKLKQRPVNNRVVNGDLIDRDPGPAYAVTPEMRKQAKKSLKRALSSFVSEKGIKRTGGFGIAD